VGRYEYHMIIDDIAQPPDDPPSGCGDRETWRRAMRLYAEHTPDADGTCARCGGRFPCRGRRLGRSGLLTAMGDRAVDARRWAAYARVLAL